MAILGAAAGGAFPQLTITTSMTWVPPQDGTVCIHVVAAGGSGYGGSGGVVAGGGAGAYGKVPSLAVTTSGSFTLVVGSGGIGGANNNSYSAGVGGSSQISGTGLTGTKTAGGGYRGSNAGQGSTNGAGGTVSGSGEGWAGNSGGAALTSGGAVGIYGTGQAGTDAMHIGGGGMTDARAGGLGMSGFGIICGGSQVSYSASLYQHQEQQTTPPVAGDLCGGGAIDVSSANQYTPVFGGRGGIGGGGGGGKNRGSVADSFGGNGGDGIILIQYLPW